MKNSHQVTVHGAAKGTGRTYTTGFLLSLVLTMIAYRSVTHHWLGHRFAIGAILVLALTQLFVQLWFFLHLGKESKPRWNLTVLSFAVAVVLILVLGSIWIMYHLNYNMKPDSVNRYIMQEENIQK